MGEGGKHKVRSGRDKEVAEFLNSSRRRPLTFGNAVAVGRVRRRRRCRCAGFGPRHGGGAACRRLAAAPLAAALRPAS